MSEADAFGFLAAGYLTPQRLAEQLAELRALTARPFGVNAFSRPPVPADPETYAEYADEIRRLVAARDLPVGEPRFHSPSPLREARPADGRSRAVAV